MLLKAEDITKEFAGGAGTVRALREVSFTIDRGEFVTIVGPSGSGKSTTLQLLGLLDTPTTGTIELEGTDIESYSDRDRTGVRKETIGFVFQSYGLVPTLTALENVAVPRMLDADPAATEQRAQQLLERVGLGDRLNHYPDELSGGQKQRVAIARSLINEPELVLADEPTGNLDRDTGERVLTQLTDVTDDDVTIVAVTHDEYVAAFSDRILRLVDGQLRRDQPDRSVDDASTAELMTDTAPSSRQSSDTTAAGSRSRLEPVDTSDDQLDADPNRDPDPEAGTAGPAAGSVETESEHTDGRHSE